MPGPLNQSYSASSDYFDNDPDFVRAIQELQLPGDATYHATVPAEPANTADNVPQVLAPPPVSHPELKRRRQAENDNEDDDDGLSHHRVLSSVDQDSSNTKYLNSDVYGASHFGAWGEYMSRKRAKLQIQNTEMNSGSDRREESVQKSGIFRGVQIYINGWTEPSVQDLRKLIIQHGGIFHAYLDKKSLVTHVITCSLTPAKVREFKYMKLVRPEWLVDSVNAGTLLPWHDYIFKPEERPEDSQGRRAAQTSLLGRFSSQRGQRSADAKINQSPAEASDVRDVESTSARARGPSMPPGTPTKATSTSPTSKPIYSTDPATPEQAKRLPGYAEAGANRAAERAMADPAWRAAHTSVAPDFIEGYYRNSRLHHLSTWKAELRNLVAEAQERAENGIGTGTDDAIFVDESNDGTVGKIVRENMRGKDWMGDGSGEDVSMRGAQLLRKGKGKEKAIEDEERVIMHCDFDSFFVSAGLVDRPHLRGKPVVVCHSQRAQGGQASTSEIASASYEAREFGIRGGMSLKQARQLCPGIITIPYEFRKYKQYSLQLYTILMAHADDLQAVSVDEVLIDVTSSVRRINVEIARSQDSSGNPIDPAKEFAEAIRAQVKSATGCEVSIGISHNIMLARLASRKAKPAGSYHLFLHDLPGFLEPLEIDDLHGFGRSAWDKSQEKLSTTKLAELAKLSKAVLCDALGKSTGETLYNAIRGVDHRKLESDKPRKSVSCDINYGIRFEDNGQVEVFVYQLAEEVVRRLNSIEMRGRSLTLRVMKRDPTAPVEAPKFMGHGMCDTFNKQVQLLSPTGQATDDPKVIGEHAWRVLKSMNIDPKELRGIGIQVQKLEKADAAPEVEPGQALLPFKPVTAAPKLREDKLDEAPAGVSMRVEPPSQPVALPERPAGPPPAKDLAFVDLPSFSQVDMSVFEALPDDVRRELEQEYRRRSATPALPPPPRPRSPSAVPQLKPKTKITVRGTTKSPNLKRITRQLAPRSRSSISTAKTKLFAGPSSSPAVKVSIDELRRLDIDPEVFRLLPLEVQREQLALMRQKKAPGGSGLAFGSQRKTIKPTKLKVKPIPKRPPPKAVFLQPPSLKQRGQAKGEKLYFTEKDDVQRVIEAWVDGFREYPPNQKDVDFFAKFLVQCVDSGRSSDAGVERAVAVAKWWLVLLRRHFGSWEGVSENGWIAPSRGPYTSEAVGRAWWRAFREVKEKMDVTARKKFGGCLSLR